MKCLERPVAVATRWNRIEERSTKIETHHIHAEESNEEGVVSDACYEDADCFGFGEVESKEEEKLAKEEGNDKGEENLGGLVAQLLQPTVEEHMENQANQTGRKEKKFKNNQLGSQP